MGKDNNTADRDKMSIHHIIGKCNHVWANVNERSNKMLLSCLKHQAFNTVMRNNQEPQRQLAVLYEEYRKPTLSRTACELIEVLLSMDKDVFYREELIKNDKRKREVKYRATTHQPRVTEVTN